MKRILSLALVLVLCLSTFTVCSYAAVYVAEVDGTKYTDVNSAWNAVKDGGSISMLADWNIKSPLEVPEDKVMTINMNGHMINRGLKSISEDDGNVITVEDSAKLTINGGDKYVVHKGYFSAETGAWVYAGSGVFGTAHNISGGLITGGCNKEGGGGLIIVEDAQVTLIDVTIAGNRTEEYGAGVYMEDSNELVMERSHIMYNYASTDGGGVFMDENNCKIKGDNISSVSNNSAANWGGGIYTDGVSDGEISKVIIKNNHAKKGGGVLVDNDSTVLLKDITITNNTADETGAGVFCEAYGISAAHIILSGKVIIKDNFKGEGQNNIMLETARARTASYEELNLTEDSEVGFGAGINKIRMVVTSNGIYNKKDNTTKVFMDHDAGWEYAVEEAQLINGVGNKRYNVSVKLLEDWNAVSGNFNPNADEGFAWGAIWVPEGVTITMDMNGHTIHRHQQSDGWNNEVILVNGTLYLSDGRILGGYSNNGGGGIHIDGGKAVLKNVEVTGNRTLDDDGAGIHVINGTLEATDCNIHHNKAYEDSIGAQGAGVYANSSTVKLTNTEIKYNETFPLPNVGFNLIQLCEGGGIYAVDSNVTVTNCKFEGNYSHSGGTDICAKDSTVSIVGSKVNKNWVRNDDSIVTIDGKPFPEPEVVPEPEPELEGTTTEGAIELEGTTTEGAVELEGTTTEGAIELEGTTTEGAIELEGTTTEGAIELEGTTTEGAVELEGATTEGAIETEDPAVTPEDPVVDEGTVEPEDTTVDEGTVEPDDTTDADAEQPDDAVVEEGTEDEGTAETDDATVDEGSDESDQSEVTGSVFGGGSVIAIIGAVVVIAGGVAFAVRAKKKNN